MIQYGDTRAFPDMPAAYPALRDLVLERGHRVAPRGEPTIEVLNMGFRIEDAVRRGVPVGCGRKVGVKMMAIDVTQNLAGAVFPDVSIAVAPVLERFADTLEPSEHLTRDVVLTANAAIGEPFFQGAYGPRMGTQLRRVERQLRADPDTRQAVVSLWREADGDPFWKDRPCTTEVQFMIREGRLEVTVYMRANDLWTGTCYDVYQFAQVQAAMANVLGVETGPYHHYAASLHVYERDVEKFEAVSPWPLGLGRHDTWTDQHGRPHKPFVRNPRESFGPSWDGVEYHSWDHVQERFFELLLSIREGRDFRPENQVERWHHTVLTTGQAPL